MKRICAMLLLMMASCVFAADPYRALRLDMKAFDEPWGITVNQAANENIRVYLYNDGVKWQPTSGVGGVMGWGTNYEDSTGLVLCTGVISTTDNYIQFGWTPQQLNSNGIFFAQVKVTNSASSWVWPSGQMQINKSPVTTGIGLPSPTSIIYWNLYNGHSGLGAYGPYHPGSGMGFSTNVDGSVNMNYTGAGAGDMLAANNLSDLANKQAAVTNLGLAGVSGSVTRVENTTNQYCRTNEARDLNLYGDVTFRPTEDQYVTLQGTNSNSAFLNVVSYRNDAGAGGINLYGTRGTESLPTILQNNDVIGSFFFKGYGGAAWFNGASIVTRVEGTPGTNDMPTKLILSTTPDGSATPSNRVTIHQDGLLEFHNGTASNLTLGPTVGWQGGKINSATNTDVVVGSQSNLIAGALQSDGSVQNAGHQNWGGYTLTNFYGFYLNSAVYFVPEGTGWRSRRLFAEQYMQTPTLRVPDGSEIDTTNLYNIVSGGVVTTSALQSATAGLSATQAQNTAAIAALQQVTVFGATNAHPVLGTNYASFVSTLPATAWTNTYSVPSNGTYLVGNRFETNSVTNIVSGDYVHNVWTEVNSANTLGYYYSVLVAISASSNVTVLGTGANIFPSTLRVSHSSTIHMQTNTVFTNAVYRGVLRYFVRTGGTPGSTFSIFGGDGYDTKLTRGVSFDETTDAQTLQGYTPQTLMQQTVYTVYTNDPALTNVNISLANGYHQVFAGTQPLQVVNLPDISGYAGQQVKLRIDMRPGTNALTTTGMAGQVRLSAGWTITNSTTIPSRTLWDKSALETNWTGAVINL